jgi:hypothetical protein
MADIGLVENEAIQVADCDIRVSSNGGFVGRS